MTGRMMAMDMERGASWRRAMMMLPMDIIGVSSISVANVSRVCTCCTSLVLRVMSDGVPNLPISLWERLSTLR